MNNAFQILTGFLNRYDEDVEGRELQVPGPDIEAKFQQFARGNLPKPERAGFLELLGQHPEWLGRLAIEVKSLRSLPDAAD